jgi:hypothetical protein
MWWCCTLKQVCKVGGVGRSLAWAARLPYTLLFFVCGLPTLGSRSAAFHTLQSIVCPQSRGLKSTISNLHPHSFRARSHRYLRWHSHESFQTTDCSRFCRPLHLCSLFHTCHRHGDTTTRVIVSLRYPRVCASFVSPHKITTREHSDKNVKSIAIACHWLHSIVHTYVATACTWKGVEAAFELSVNTS